jgi:L-iditol 2-dehydrogenase
MIPDTMKAVVIEAPRKAVVRIVPTPVPVEGEVLIRLEKALICTWEQRIFAGIDMPLPFVPGHEISGVVASVPENTITDLKPGEKVVVKTFDSCGQCEDCYRGDDNLCKGKAKKRFYGGVPGAGGFARYIAIAANRVYRLPNQAVSLETAAFAEPVACCLRSLEQADIQLGEDVVIVGGGIMGQLHCLLSKLRGGRVILAEPDKARRDMAASLGADVTIDPKTEDSIARIRELTNGGAHVVFFTVNSLALAQDYIGSLRRKGRLVYYGSFHPKGDIPFSPSDIHYGEYTITGSYSPTVKGFWTAGRLLSCGLLNPAPFISGRYPIDDCQKALERAGSPDTYRVLLDLA